MKYNRSSRQLIGFVFTGLLGTFLHFLFDLTGGSAAAGLVSAVNESIWEHMKLIFYPMLLFAALDYAFGGRDGEGFWCIKLRGILLALVLIPVLYYSYTGILGRSADWFNVTIFFLAAGAAFGAENRLFRSGGCRLPAWAALLLLAVLAALFTVFTFRPPHIPLFQDPITGSYGFLRLS